MPRYAPLVDTAERDWIDLPNQHQTFVTQYIAHGDAIQAAKEAGYKDNEHIKTRARELRQMLSNHIDEQTAKYVRSTDVTILGMHVLKDLAQKAESETVKLNAAKEILNRSVPDLPKKTEIVHKVKTMTDEDLDRKILQLQRDLGLYAIDVTPEKAGTH